MVQNGSTNDIGRFSSLIQSLFTIHGDTETSAGTEAERADDSSDSNSSSGDSNKGARTKHKNDGAPGVRTAEPVASLLTPVAIPARTLNIAHALSGFGIPSKGISNAAKSRDGSTKSFSVETPEDRGDRLATRPSIDTLATARALINSLLSKNRGTVIHADKIPTKTNVRLAPGAPFSAQLEVGTRAGVVSRSSAESGSTAESSPRISREEESPGALEKIGTDAGPLIGLSLIASPIAQGAEEVARPIAATVLSVSGPVPTSGSGGENGNQLTRAKAVANFEPGGKLPAVAGFDVKTDEETRISEEPVAFAALLSEKPDSGADLKAPETAPGANAIKTALPAAVTASVQSGSNEKSLVDATPEIKTESKSEAHSERKTVSGDQAGLKSDKWTRTEQPGLAAGEVQRGLSNPQTHVTEDRIRDAPGQKPAAQSSGIPQPAETLDVSKPPAITRTEVKEIAFRIQDLSGGSVEVHVAERGGNVQVTVRASDPTLSSSLRSELGELVKVLGERGYHIETWTPSESRPANHAAGMDVRSATASENAPDRQSDSQQGDGGEHQRRQQHGQQQSKRNWVEELKRKLEGE